MLLEQLIANRNEAYHAFAISGDLKDRAIYNKRVKELLSFVQENGIKYEPIDLFVDEPVLYSKKKEIDKSLEVGAMDDSPTKIDDFLINNVDFFEGE